MFSFFIYLRFRVLKGFVAQFGLRSSWRGPDFKRVRAGKMLQAKARMSNVRGTLAFAGSSPTQVRKNMTLKMHLQTTSILRFPKVFVNLGNNVRLDTEVSELNNF